MTPDASELCVFAVKRGDIQKRVDVHANHPKFSVIFERLKNHRVVRLKDCAECIFSGITPKSGGDAYTDNDDGVLFVKSGCLSNDGSLTVDISSKIKYEIHNGIMKSSKLKKNDILIAIVGATIGKVALFDLDIEANINQAIAAIRVKDIIMPEFLVVYMLSPFGQAYLDYLKRPVARANINLEEIGQIEIPLLSIGQQERFINAFYSARELKEHKIGIADELLRSAKDSFFSSLEIYFFEYTPSLFNFSRLKDLREMGIVCNPHSAYLNDVFALLRKSKYYAGKLEDFVEVNPFTDRKDLDTKSVVSFVPMPAVDEKINGVTYQLREYQEVKTGFTAFKKNDLLWAKITPCMQNGKSFLATDMPTEYGFGSTEFHVLRQKSNDIYMPYLWVLLSDEYILEAAQGMFCGSAGQQRVPDIFLKNFPIVLPPYEMQKSLADNVFQALDLSKQMHMDAEQEWTAAKMRFEKELLED